MDHLLIQSASPDTSALLARLQSNYQAMGFTLEHRDFLACHDNSAAPAWLIVFEHDGVLCFDPLTFGFYACDPQQVYGISIEDAQAIRAHNKVAGA